MTFNQIMWNFEPRAIVPSDVLLHSRDVIAPTVAHAESSPHPFGLGIYTCPRYGRKKALPYVYVSPSVAADRAKTSNVKEGWYAIARPGINFELRTTRVNSRWGKLDDVFTTCTYVNEECTNHTHSFKHEDVRAEFIISGYAEQHGRLDDEIDGKKVRTFLFQMPDTLEEVKGKDSKLNVIHMDTYVAAQEQGNRHSSFRGNHQNAEKRFVGGKLINIGEEGMSARGDRQRSGKRIWRDHASLGSKKPEVTITVFMREASWMRSKKLIDDDGRPCTYQMFLELTKKDYVQSVHNRFETSSEEGRAAKKVKTQANMSGKAAISHIVHDSES